jgi:two-component system, cell cycle response regulator
MGVELVLSVPEEAPTWVLVVEDDPVSAHLIQKLLSSQGIVADWAASGREAMTLLESCPYRVVISDWMMPEVSGIDLCQMIRARSDSYVYFILCSAKGDRDERAEAYEAGVDDFLSKPLDRSELQARLTVARRILEIQDDLKKQKRELEATSRHLRDANANLTIASRRFQELFNGLPVPCFTFDEEGLVHEWNRCAETAFGIPGHVAFQSPVWELLGGNANDFWSEEIVSEVFRGASVPGIDWTLTMPDGEKRYFVCSIFTLRKSDGVVTGAVSANLDITERKMAERRIDEQMLQINEIAFQLELQRAQLLEANVRLERLADTDGLTGLYNHRKFQEDLERLFSQHRRTGKVHSVLLLDVDHFKSYNDTYGHQAGDEVLRQLAQILKVTCRSHELVARYGGEEFAIVLEGADLASAALAAERFRHSVIEHHWPIRPVTASFGVATVGPWAPTQYELIQQADDALYAAKTAGRNCVAVFDPDRGTVPLAPTADAAETPGAA